MAALAAVTGPTPALLLLAALLAGASAYEYVATWPRCNQYRYTSQPVPAHGRDDKVTALLLYECEINELNFDDFNKTNLPNLTLISLSKNKLEHVDAAVFTPVSHVNELSINSNRLREVPVFGAFPNLEGLDLSSNRIAAISNEKTFASCVQLEWIYLQWNKIEHIHSNAFNQLHHLRKLVLRFNKIKFISETIFQIKSLTVLNLEDNLIEYVGTHAFRGTNLTMLLIHNNRLNYLPLDFVSDLSNLSTPTEIVTWSNAFAFHANPWHCACLLELFRKINRNSVHYLSSYIYTGTQPECVFLGRHACHRHTPSTLLPSSRTI